MKLSFVCLALIAVTLMSGVAHGAGGYFYCKFKEIFSQYYQIFPNIQFRTSSNRHNIKPKISNFLHDISFVNNGMYMYIIMYIYTPLYMKFPTFCVGNCS